MKDKCNDNLAKCFCEKKMKHKGLHVCRCGGSWDNEKFPHSFPDISLGFNAFPNTEEEKNILKTK